MAYTGLYLIFEAMERVAPRGRTRAARADAARWHNAFRAIVGLALTVVAVGALISWADASIATNLRVEFLANSEILAPYVDARQEALWRSAFASMKTNADYDRLMASLRWVAAEHRVVLQGDSE